MSSSRLEHSIRVSNTSKELADIYGLDKNILEFAGLVHDIAKEQSPQLLSNLGLDLQPYQDMWIYYPSVWHAFVGPLLSSVVFPYVDFKMDGIIDLHTTGDESMSKEAMVLFIADFVEPERVHPELSEIRQIARESLENAVARITRCSINKLINKSVSIHPKTWQCWNYYCKYILNS